MSLWVGFHPREKGVGESMVGSILDSGRISISSNFSAELRSLGRERDPDIFYEGLLLLGQRLEADNHLEAASSIYSTIVGSETCPAGVSARAQARLDAITGVGSFGLRTEFLLRRLARETMEPTTLLGMTAASAAFRITRLVSLSRLLTSPTTNLATRGFGAQAAASLLGFGVEATVFPLASRGAAVALGRDLDWSLNQVGRDIAGSFIILGAMKLTGWAAAGRSQGSPLQGLLRQTGMFAGITLGHHLETAVGLRPHLDGATTFIDSLAMLVQFNAAGRLAHGMMGEGFRAWESGLDHQAQSLTSMSWRGPQGRSYLFATNGNHPFRSGDPRDYFPANSFMVGSGDGMSRGKPTPRALRPVLRQVERLGDPKKIGQALRWIYTAIVGPLRSKVFHALDAIEGGEDAQRVMKTLINDPCSHETIFLTKEFGNETAGKIRQLARGEVRLETGRMRALLPPSSPPSGASHAQNYKNLSSDEVIRLNLERAEAFVTAFRNYNGELPLPADQLLQDVLALQAYLNGVTRRTIRQADIDTLTGIFNRFYWDRQIPDLERRMMRNIPEGEASRRSDWILLIDIDHFKKINDTYGHTPNGDEALWSVAQNISQALRPRDIAVRWGGEEFVVYLFNSGSEGAARLAEQIRRTVEQTEIEIQEIPSVVSIRAKVSIGGAEMRLLQTETGEWTSEGAIQDALRRADVSLYEAKNSGRNRVVLPEN